VDPRLSAVLTEQEDLRARRRAQVGRSACEADELRRDGGSFWYPTELKHVPPHAAQDPIRINAYIMFCSHVRRVNMSQTPSQVLRREEMKDCGFVFDILSCQTAS
jgi:hypothetical protein